MSNATVVRALYRACLRFSSAVDGVPFELLSRDAKLLCPHSPLAAVVATQGSQQIRWLAEHEFRQCADHQGEAANEALDRGFAALQVLTSEYGEKVQRMRELRASRADRDTPGVAFSVGQVFRHRKFDYCGIIYGWDPSCERDSEWAAQLDVRHRQPFYHVLPDENDCVKLFKAVRISKYVAQENIEPLPYPRRCTHRVLPNYFEGYDPVTGRYVPNAQLAFEYPDESYKELGAAAPLGSDGNLLMRDDPMSQLTASERFLRAALAVEATPQK